MYEDDRDASADGALAYYVLDGRPVLLDPRRGPLDLAGRKVDPRAWMDRALPVTRDEFLRRAGTPRISSR